MAHLIIRNLPDEVYPRLKEQAKRNRRSLNQEVIAVLSAGSGSEENQIARQMGRRVRTIERIAALRMRMKGFMTSQEIDEAIREGRR